MQFMILLAKDIRCKIHWILWNEQLLLASSTWQINIKVLWSKYWKYCNGRFICNFIPFILVKLAYIYKSLYCQ